MQVVYIFTYFGKVLVIEWEINGLIITWLYTLTKIMQLIALIMKLSYNDFKIWKLVEKNFNG